MAVCWKFAELFDFKILEFNDVNQEIFENYYHEFKAEIGTNKAIEKLFVLTYR